MLTAALFGGPRPLPKGLTVFAAKAQGLEAARGATDFGEYFIYFSFFLVISALLLTGLFFKLGVEQRMREIGVLRALGFSLSQLRLIFLMEGAVLAAAGWSWGPAPRWPTARLIMIGLRTWWIDAVGTGRLSLHASIGIAGYRRGGRDGGGPGLDRVDLACASNR